MTLDSSNHPSTPSYILKNIATDGKFYVCRYVVTHPNVTIEILKLLIKGKDSFICFKWAQRLLSLINISPNKDDMYYIQLSENILKHFNSHFK
ncbi:hypothetical protein NIES2101_33005 [Calothrix sp. HK-06]|nr:hypothetical protein NIES2101_33005 [Calothrix sp. HK-06]